MLDVAVYREALKDVRREIAEAESRLAKLRLAEKYHASKITLPGEEFAYMFVRQAAEIILERADRPMKTSEVAAAILAGGYQTKNPAGFRNIVFGILKVNRGTFRNLGGRWALTKDTGEGP